MKKRFLKICSVAVLAIMFSSTMAFANLAYVFLTAAEMAAPFIIEKGVQYFLPAAGSVNIGQHADNYNPVTKTITRNAIAAKSGKGYAVGLTVALTALAGYLLQSDYPALNQAVYNQAGYPALTPSTSASATVGQVYTVPDFDSSAYTVVEAVHWDYSDYVVRWGNNHWIDVQGDIVYEYFNYGDRMVGAYHSYTGADRIAYSINQKVSGKPLLSPAELTQNLIDPVTGDLPTAVSADIARLVQEHPQNFSFPDASTIPEVQPDVPPTPEPLDIPGFSSTPFHLQQTFDTFSARTTTFTNAIKASPLFTGFATYLAFPAMGGGTSVVSFDALRFGVHSFDFADLGSQFAIIRGFVTLIAGVAGVKLALLGRA